MRTGWTHPEMFQCHACRLLELCIVLRQGVGVEKQSLGNKAAVREGGRAPTAGPPIADSKSGHDPLTVRPGAKSRDGYYCTELLPKNTGLVVTE